MNVKLKLLSIVIVLLIILTGCDIVSSPGATETLTDRETAESVSADTSQKTESSSSEEESDNDPSDACNHKDEDDNGVCDTCSVSVIVYIDFYAVNDLHGKFDDTESNCGVDELTTYLKNAQKNDDKVILLSSGDMWQGSSESNLTKGLIITEWMNHLDFSSMTLGNHEFDWGDEFITHNKSIADFPMLGINIYDRDTGNPVEYCSPSVIIERDGIQIGIIGAIGDCYSSISADKVENVYFKTGIQLDNLVKAEAERLRSIGVDYIVYSVHEGYSSVGSSLTDGYVDLVFEGHTHQSYVNKDVNGVYHLQNGGDNRGISHVEIKINSANNNSSVIDAEFVSSSRYSRLDDDPIVDTLLNKYSDMISKANEVCGYNDRMRGSNEIRSLVAKLYYEAGKDRWGDDYDIVLGGGFLSARSPYEISAGEVIYGDIQSVLPFDNEIVLCSIQGKYLQSRFFETDNSNYFIYYEEFGESIKNSIDPYKTYYIVTDTYSSSYGPNHLTVIEKFDDITFARDLIAQFIKDGGWTETKNGE